MIDDKFEKIRVSSSKLADELSSLANALESITPLEGMLL